MRSSAPLVLRWTAVTWAVFGLAGLPAWSSPLSSSLRSLALLQPLLEVPACCTQSEASLTYKGRRIAPVMGAAGADWLTREERERLEQPEKVLDALALQEGMTVADVGAGVGYFSLRLARRVGSSGRVLATDVQQEMLNLLKKNVEREKLSNVQLILSSPSDPRLPTAVLDLALLVDVYHELQFPEQTIAGIRKALKPAGRLVLVEYRAEDATVPIRPEHKMTVEQVLGEILPMGFQLKEKLEFLPWQHIFVFVKAAGLEAP